MATHKYNLIELYKKAFNIKGVRLDTSKGFVSDVPNRPIPHKLSVLGTPIYEHFRLFLMSPYKVGQSQNVVQEYVFPDWPLMDISASKNIVITPLKNRDGTQKELINIDDYQITIRGLLINYDSDEYPEQLVYDFNSFFKLNESLGITNSVLNLLDVHQVVIKAISLPALEGYNNVQPYVIQCLSDEPILMTIKDVRQQNAGKLRGS